MHTSILSLMEAKSSIGNNQILSLDLERIVPAFQLVHQKGPIVQKQYLQTPLKFYRFESDARKRDILP